MPPTKTIETYGERIPLEAVRADLAVRVPQTVEAGSKIRRGAVLGVVTADGYTRERARTKAAGTGFSDASDTGQVEDASVFKVGDELTLEDGTAIGTVESINTATTPDTIVLEANAAVNVAVGDAVMASDGSQVAQSIADEAVAVTETTDTVLSVYIGGFLKKDQLVGLDASAIAELGGAVNPNNIFKF
ncbi:MAG TPA: hypothetical protein VJU84_08620 [Pyrinomonadaceae bacterium]|nr:hypothetical protein [Pyrinomonadaceae bacterium]